MTKLKTKPSDCSHLKEFAPIRIEFELTEACNLKCLFCYNSQKPRYSEHAYEILECLAAEGILEIVLTGGEPLLHQDFFGILDQACCLIPHVMIQSNGTLMDRATIERIHRHKLFSVNISLHGSRDTHEKLTGVRGSFATALRAISDFISRGQIRLASNFVLTSENIHELRDVIHMLCDVGLQEMTLTRFVLSGVGQMSPSLSPTSGQFLYALEVVDDEMKEYERPHILMANAVPLCVLPAHLRYLGNYCSYGYDRFYVDVDGDLITCGMARVPMGNILNQTIREIKAQSSVFNRYLRGEHVPTRCWRCDLFPQCRGGCRAAAIGMSGELDALDPLVY